MAYLSLDQAIKTTGYAIFDDKHSLVEYGNFTIPANKPIEQRLHCIMEELNKLTRQYKIEHLYFEGIQYQSNAETYKKLAYVQATIMLWCYYQEIPFSILKPSEWRASIKSAYGLGFGRAREEQKSKALEFCKTQYQVDVTSDEADAICLGCAALLEKQSKKSAF